MWLYGRDIEQYLRDEVELGSRVASFFDMENGWDPQWFQYDVENWREF